MYQFKWLPSGLVPPDELSAFANLYSQHYGIWGDKGYSPGNHVRLNAEKLRAWLTPESRVVWATIMGEIVGYAIALVTNMPNIGSVAWVTQLVVHEEHRRKDIAKRLLFSVWQFTDHYAWGVLSANPYAIRALEKATRRRCKPVRIKVNVKHLLQVGRSAIPYVKDAGKTIVEDDKSRIDTHFFLDHSQLERMLADVSHGDSQWALGTLPEGWEWFAFTFRDQSQLSLSQNEIDEMLAVSDQVTHHAYSRMPIRAASQAWAQHGKDEVKFIMDVCELTPGKTVLDFGCGEGRHSFELASKGIDVTGVDYVHNFIETAKLESHRVTTGNLEYLQADCGEVELEKKFDAGICLYDVIGSYTDENRNIAILRNLVSHVKPGGSILLSVMNMELTERLAKHFFTLKSDPDKLLELKPSGAMEKTGEVFNPDFYMIDEDTRIVYRKEQFQAGEELPEELIVRDRRYTEHQIRAFCIEAGLDVLWSRYVRAGHWHEPLPKESSRAKEILLLCRKPESPALQRQLFSAVV